MESTTGGILLVDKAAGWTSHDVVAKTRRALGTRKVGHAGTLDPMATGLLVLGVGPATRLLTHLVGLDKTYTATVRLGAATVTDDREGDELPHENPREVTRRVQALVSDPEPLRQMVVTLTGSIEQVPSAVSAIKVDGRRAYDRVRAGEHVELKKRPVTIHEFILGESRSTITDEGGALLDVEVTVRCSSGTYVRALARDLGDSLGVGGHLVALRRIAVGPFALGDTTLSTATLADTEPGTLPSSALLTPAEVATKLFPTLQLTAQQQIDLGHGKRLELAMGQCDDAPLVAAIAPDGSLIGLVSVRAGRTKVVTNFPILPAQGAENSQ